jgi:hypothetical protein
MSNLVTNGSMTFNPSYFNYTLNQSQTSILGEHFVIITCQGNTNGFSTFSFLITENGKPEPSGIITILFIVFLLIILAGLLFTAFNSISRVAFKEFYLVDVIISIGLYLVLVIYNYLSTIYFPNELVAKILFILMKIGVWTHVFIPLVAFFIVLVLNWRTYNTEKDNLDNYAPMNTNLDWQQKRNNRTYEPKFYRK